MRIRLGAFLLLSVALGCQGNPSPTAPVTGRVTFRGFPLQSGMIVFTPDSAKGCRGAMAIAKIGGDGTYTLRSGETPGAAVGWYRVTVASLATTYNGSAVPQSLVPEKYRDPDLSKLVGEVKANQPNRIDFNLE